MHVKAANQSLDLTEAIDRFNAHSPWQLRVRIGLVPGATVSAVIGERAALFAR